MPDFLRAQGDRRSAPARLGYHLLDLVSYEGAYLLGPARHELFFNAGYLPLAGDLVLPERLEPEAHAAMMYHLVARSHPAEAGVTPAPRRLLDVGCGPGGGLLYMAALYPRAQLCGTERAMAGRRLARRHLPGARILSPRARLPGPFDLVTGVGTPTYIGLAAFLARFAPELAPGGVISISGGYRQGDHARVRRTLESAAAPLGLQLLSYRDIARHTFAALQADIPRREAAMARLPRPLRAYARRWADLPGTPEYEEYRSGRRCDFAAVLRAG
ncbi:MAG: hypothetical protein GYB53_19120 [Rhodobacteraceae bacterium]|nr:hypothetical protein [Paracoccaceae bacterium]MBR9819602.1 hypothetical protein [Paracoccaceae bacterium]